ncbi:MAG TPA: ABC transporter permease subunit [Candidatus Eisenbacteria bacterium]|nr:ABC transporter permease subunit [Candidatus Eisenbacteria bacterium]
MITIARVTIGEAARRRVLWVLVVLAVVAVTATGWGVERLVSLARESGVDELQLKLGVSQILIFIAFQFGFVLAMTAAFLGSPAIAGDLESGIALALLARPLRRSSYLLGRWLGLAVVILVYSMASGLLAIGVVGLVSGYSPPNPLVPVLYLAAQALVMLSLTVFLSTHLSPIAGGAVAVVAYGMAWMAGVLGHIGVALGAQGLAFISDVGRAILPTDGLWQGVIYGLEPAIVLAAAANQPGAQGNPFFASEPPPPTFLAWTVVWVAIVLGLAILQLRRREL